MYVKAIKYKEWWLAPGSLAYQLYEDGKKKELDNHLKQVENNYFELIKKGK